MAAIIIAGYDSAWPRIAEGYARDLRALGPWVLAVHHIGSTSVPGLAAKPVIDLMPLVADLDELDRNRPRIEALGYEWRGEFGIAGRRYCALSDAAGMRKAQLHFFEAGSHSAVRHIAFRDYLRAHPEAVRAYEAEKRKARAPHPDDVHAYTDAKAAWIQAAEAEALAWIAMRRALDRQSS